MKTVLITGCSSGFGLQTAQYFLNRDWKVIATMRSPREDLLPRSERLRVLALDVTNSDSIHQAVEAAGAIDVLVNNAGIGVLSALEGTSMETAREVFETNTLGTIAVTQAVLPRFRQQKAGIIVNVTSSVTLKPLALLSVWRAVNDPSCPARIPAGADAVELAESCQITRANLSRVAVNYDTAANAL